MDMTSVATANEEDDQYNFTFMAYSNYTDTVNATILVYDASGTLLFSNTSAVSPASANMSFW